MLYAKIAAAFFVIAALVSLEVFIYNQGRRSILSNIAETSLSSQEDSNAIFNKQQIKSKKQICLDLSGGDTAACAGLPD